MRRIASRAGTALLCAAAVLGVLAACQSDGGSEASAADGLYLTDTYSGKVYVYDPDTHAAGSTSLVTTGQNSTGGIRFYGGIGYVAVASYNNTDPGVYRFDPSATVPAAERIGTVDRSAQFVAFYSSTKAYVTVADYYGTAADQGVYTFNPSSPSSGLSAAPITGTNASGMYLQQIVVGPDNMVYVADYDNQKVYRIDPATDTLSATPFPASSSGTTALVSGSYNGSSGVFVGNIAYNATTYAYTGSVDFIDTGASSVSTVLASTPASRMLYLSAGKLVTTSYSNTYLADVTAASPTPLEMGSSLAGADLAARDGLIYVAYTDYSTSRLYVFDATAGAQSFSPVSVMGSGECVAGLAFYED